MRQSNLSAIVTRPSRPPDWVVPDVLHRGTMVVVAGQPGIGKSALFINLTVSLATATPFLGRDLQEGKVLYFDEENSQPDFEEYLRWAWKGMGRPDPKLLDKNIRMERFSLSEKSGQSYEGNYKYLREAASEFQPDLIVIDTATPACQIKDENDNGLATDAIGKLRSALILSPQACMVVLKHAKIDSENGAYTVRGAKAWVGATDATLFHMGVGGHPRSDGLKNTQFVPEKTRAFGLKTTLKIRPDWIGEGLDKGLQLEQMS